ncbi:MAG TPA: 2,3-bisphosphoglycerate-independent phosphoglycerate mutase [Planctomycetes bacterium]|nr:2,3-bisphosphoglycerate-independent phosphoglycerate mutase [Planctomycetota bacterium]
MNHRPLVLIVLDGFGCRESAEHNAVKKEAHHFHEYLARYPSAKLSASGREVGLPLGLMGNSEVGHTNLGAGRVVYQDITRIDKAIEDGEFATNGAFVELFDRLKREGKALHLIGLVGTGGVHASEAHLAKLLELAKAQGMAPDKVFVHALMDGRDTPPRSGEAFLETLERDIASAGVGRIASVVGRYWAMDRDKRWERTERAFDLLTRGVGERYDSAAAAIRANYANDVGDEFVEPSVIGAPDQGRMADGDGVLCFNFRADRMRQIVSALGLEDFDGFERSVRPRLEIVTMTQYRADFPFAIAFPPQELHGTFGEVISAAGLRQERMAETEKYAHVTFFFSGGQEAELPGESRTLVPSPKVATYDLQPEMSAPELTARIVASLKRGETDVYVINFANADMVGHTGIESAAEAAVRTIDTCLSQIVPLVTSRGGVVAITADHGNAEQMYDPTTHGPHTAHTTNPVPIVFCAEDLIGADIRPMGILADVAPTLLTLGGIEVPSEMTGHLLLG